MHPTSLIQNSFTNDLIETINSKSSQKYTEKGETGETGQIGKTGEIEEKEESGQPVQLEQLGKKKVVGSPPSPKRFVGHVG